LLYAFEFRIVAGPIRTIAESPRSFTGSHCTLSLDWTL
jgi:hypothetical protein